jgi:hypothetical protein
LSLFIDGYLVRYKVGAIPQLFFKRDYSLVFLQNGAKHRF